MRAATTTLLALLLTACATWTTGNPACLDGQDCPSSTIIADRLFCGRAIPGGGTVTDDEWNAFVREVVAPRFPQGFTVFSAQGQWLGNDGVVVREPVMILEILHPLDRELDRRIDEIADEYKRRFRQEAVMRVTMPARMELID